MGVHLPRPTQHQKISKATCRKSLEQFLSGGDCGHREGSERSVNGVAKAGETCGPAFLVLVVGQGHGEAPVHSEFVEHQLLAVDRWILDIDLRGANRIAAHRTRRNYCS